MNPRATFNGLRTTHPHIQKNREIFIITAVRTSNPTQIHTPTQGPTRNTQRSAQIANVTEAVTEFWYVTVTFFIFDK
jgi:hypothetical protein